MFRLELTFSPLLMPDRYPLRCELFPAPCDELQVSLILSGASLLSHGSRSLACAYLSSHEDFRGSLKDLQASLFAILSSPIVCPANAGHLGLSNVQPLNPGRLEGPPGSPHCIGAWEFSSGCMLGDGRGHLLHSPRLRASLFFVAVWPVSSKWLCHRFCPVFNYTDEE